MMKKENVKAIFFIDASVLLRRIKPSLNMLVNDPDKRILYALSELPGQKILKDGKKVSGKERQERLIKNINRIIDEDILDNYLTKSELIKVKKLADELKNQEASCQNGSEIEFSEEYYDGLKNKPIRVGTGDNLYVWCDLLATEIENKINNNKERKERKLAEYREQQYRCIVNAHMAEYGAFPIYNPIEELSYFRMSSNDISLDVRVDMLLDCYEEFFNIDISRFAEKYGIKVMILTENDPVMSRVLKAFFPNIESIVVPSQEYKRYRKSSRVLYQLLKENFCNEYGNEDLQFYLVDDNIKNCSEAFEAGFSFSSRSCDEDLRDIIIQFANNCGFPRIDFAGKVLQYLKNLEY